MKIHTAGLLLGCAIALASVAAPPAAHAGGKEFAFGVIGHVLRTGDGETALQEAIAETDADNLAFVVANGIKSAAEPCTDALYQRRRAMLDSAKNGLVLSLSASDWTGCRNSQGKTAAVERLNRLRELFFADDFTLGGTRLPVVRESATAKFRAYAENARWEIGQVMFATINLPANNNHYRTEAGRNSEFEDRAIANRDWLHRLFLFATRKKMAAIVLFCEGDPFDEPGLLERLTPTPRRDGFTEVRKQLRDLSAKYPGKVLVIHAASGRENLPRDIAWDGRLGSLLVESGWRRITVRPGTPTLFEPNALPAERRQPAQ